MLFRRSSSTLHSACNLCFHCKTPYTSTVTTTGVPDLISQNVHRLGRRNSPVTRPPYPWWVGGVLGPPPISYLGTRGYLDPGGMKIPPTRPPPLPPFVENVEIWKFATRDAGDFEGHSFEGHSFHAFATLSNPFLSRLRPVCDSCVTLR